MRGRQEALQSALSEENMKAQRERREENKGRSETEGEKEERENSPAFGLSDKGDGRGDGGVWTLSFPSKKIREALPQFSLISGELPEAPPLVCVWKSGKGADTVSNIACRQSGDVPGLSFSHMLTHIHSLTNSPFVNLCRIKNSTLNNTHTEQFLIVCVLYSIFKNHTILKLKFNPATVYTY